VTNETFAENTLLKPSLFDELAEIRKSPISVIPAPHPVRDKLQSESGFFSRLRGNCTPVFTGVPTFYEAITL
jgi:hypothetical protein